MTTKVMIVDDQELVRAGFRMVVSAHGEFRVVGEAADGAGAVQQAPLLRPDVILMDVRMPRMDGIEATRRLLDPSGAARLWGDDAPPRVIILTTFDLDEYVYDALRAGASGFLLKDVRGPQLVHAIQVVAAGEALLAPTVTRRLVSEFAGRRSPSGRSGEAAIGELTPREREVFHLIAAGKSNSAIAGELHLGETTVKTHVAKVLRKLGLTDRVQAVVFAYESGVVRPGGAGAE
jgi:DNA-binding NarL/FixJ family response regulator